MVVQQAINLQRTIINASDVLLPFMMSMVTSERATSGLLDCGVTFGLDSSAYEQSGYIR
jgi:hypothetical protein